MSQFLTQQEDILKFMAEKPEILKAGELVKALCGRYPGTKASHVIDLLTELEDEGKVSFAGGRWHLTSSK